jgi:cold-inducible RNA-binding protein
MGNKLYVGGLAYATTDEGLMQLFQQVGQVASASIIKDRETGRSKGFGFVEMSSPKEATDAIAKFDGFSLDGRAIRVSEAQERKPKTNTNRW